MIDNTIKQAKLLLPAGFIFFRIIVSFFNFKAIKLNLGRIGYKIKDIKKFSEWSLNRRYRYILTASAKIDFLEGFIINILLILQAVYFVLGLFVVTYFMEKPAVKYEISKSMQIFAPIWSYVRFFDLEADVRYDRNIPGGVQ